MHDANGTPLSKGDIVYIPAVITELFAGEDYCNVKAESLIGRRPDGSKETFYAINTGVMVLYEKAAQSEPGEAPSPQ